MSTGFRVIVSDRGITDGSGPTGHPSPSVATAIPSSVSMPFMAQPSGTTGFRVERITKWSDYVKNSFTRILNTSK
jgi:hypothetical protein